MYEQIYTKQYLLVGSGEGFETLCLFINLYIYLIRRSSCVLENLFFSSCALDFHGELRSVADVAGGACHQLSLAFTVSS